MFDLIVTGGIAVMPSGAQAGGYRRRRRQDRRDRRAGQSAVGRRRADRRRRRIRSSFRAASIPHIHCSSPIPFPGRNEDLLSAPPEQVSRAALHGGTTTLLDFAPCPPDQPLQQSIELRKREWAGACYCDYGFHLLLHGKLSQGVLGALPEAIQDGSRLGQNVHDRHPAQSAGPDGAVRRHLGGVADPRGRRRDRRDPCRGQRHRHAHVREADPRGPGRLREHGRGAQYALGGSVVQPGDPAGRECRGRRALHGARLGRDRGRGDRASRAQGFPIYGETLHQYLLYTAEDYKRPGGQMFHTYPSLKFAKDQEALWAATGHGAIQAIATDEVCCPLQVKLQGRRIDDTTGGNSGVEPRLSLMYTHMVEKRGYSLADFVGLVSSNAARIMGLYPRKGALAVGSDADIVLLDPRARRVIAQRGSARDRLHAVGGPRGRRLAEHDDPARQDGRRQRRISRQPRATVSFCRARSPTTSARAPRSEHGPAKDRRAERDLTMSESRVVAVYDYPVKGAAGRPHSRLHVDPAIGVVDDRRCAFKRRARHTGRVGAKRRLLCRDEYCADGSAGSGLCD